MQQVHNTESNNNAVTRLRRRCVLLICLCSCFSHMQYAAFVWFVLILHTHRKGHSMYAKLHGCFCVKENSFCWQFKKKTKKNCAHILESRGVSVKTTVKFFLISIFSLSFISSLARGCHPHLTRKIT